MGWGGGDVARTLADVHLQAKQGQVRAARRRVLLQGVICMHCCAETIAFA